MGERHLRVSAAFALCARRWDGGDTTGGRNSNLSLFITGYDDSIVWRFGLVDNEATVVS